MNAGSEGVESTQDLDLDEVAADWHTRMTDQQPSAQESAEFEAWIKANPAHRAAYSRIERLWSTLEQAGSDERVMRVRDQTRCSLNSRKRVRLLGAAAAAVVLAAVSAGLWVRGNRSGEASGGGSFHTAVGEHSSVVLSDGSSISLNTNTQIDIDFSHEERHVRLLRGQAWFQVARDVARPFVVQAAEQRVIALGTAFDVRIEDQGAVQVTLAEGKVRVEPVQSLLGTLIRAPVAAEELAPGESVTAQGGGSTNKKTADVAKISSWRHGQIVFDNDTLAAAVREINRYTREQIELADPSLASLRVSGVFNAGNNESFLQTVTAHFPIEIAARADGRIVLQAAAAR